MAHFGLHLAPPVAAGIVHSIVFFFQYSLRSKSSNGFARSDESRIISSRPVPHLSGEMEIGMEFETSQEEGNGRGNYVDYGVL